MRPEKLYLLDILEATRAIHRFCGNVSEDEFLDDELLQSAVLQKLMIIGEAAARLPEDFREKHQEIEWKDIIGFRNIAVHEYFSVLWEIVWNTAMIDAPLLEKSIEIILENEYQSD